jgi:RNA polymerase sigma-70 factor (ECF subfamily)
MTTAPHAVVIDEPSGDGMLLAALARGDRAALADLYDRHAPALMAVGLRILGDRPAAEAALEEVFLDLWHGARHVDPGAGGVRVWLHARVRARALARRGDTPTPEPAAAPAALGGLLPELNVVVQLAYFEGLGCAQIAERLRLPESVVRARIARAVTNLRDTTPGPAGEA